LETDKVLESARKVLEFCQQVSKIAHAQMKVTHKIAMTEDAQKCIGGHWGADSAPPELTALPQNP